MVIRGIKTKIALNVAFLLLLSALVAYILVVLVFLKVLTRSDVEHFNTYAASFSLTILSPTLSKESEQIVDEKQHILSQICSAANRPVALMVTDISADIRYLSFHPDYDQNVLLQAAKSAMQEKKMIQKAMNYEWAVFWWHPGDILMAAPFYKEEKIIGAVSYVVPLSETYAKIRQYNKPLWLYIFINTAIFTFVGLYRMFRLYLRPIDRIIIQADDYQEDEDLLFAFRREDNELNRLSSSLNRMLKRIASDRQKLRESVTSLEKANSNLKYAQQEIIRAEKMAGVGRLAAGIAHEIGNPIGIVLGYLDLLKQNDLNDKDRMDFLQRAEKETQRINSIIRQLLDLARPKETTNRSVSVHAIIEEITDVMRLQPLMRDIKIDLQLNAELDVVWANSEQLRQVLLNLFLNAADAINAGGNQHQGRIQISALNDSIMDETEKAEIIITVKDNGVGISSDQINNIFDPFYTTKEPGQGTGLGLAVSYMIIDKIGGAIHVDSELQKGTTISITLPVNNGEYRNTDYF